MYVCTRSCPVYTCTPVTLSVNAISQQLERVRCSPRSMLDPRRYLNVGLFEILKDKGFSEVRTAKLDPPRQRPGDRPWVQRAGGAPREVPIERPFGQPML